MEDALSTPPDLSPESDVSAGGTPDSPSRARLKKALKMASWGAFAVGLLVFFTLLKLPEERLKSYVSATLQNTLASFGYNLTSSESSLSIGLGVHYVLEGARLTSQANGQTLRFSKLQVHPRLLPLLLGRVSVNLLATQDGGKLDLDFTGKISQNSVIPVSFQLKATAFDLGKSQLGPFLAGVGVSGLLDGEVETSGDLQVPSSLSGGAQLKVTRLVLEAAKIEGFPIPRLSLTELALDGKIEGSKFNLTNARIGKPAGGDDLNLTARGTLLLGKTWNDVTIDVKAQFRFSDAVKKALPPLELFLTPGLGADGQYSYSLTGPLWAPNPQPAK